MSTESATGTTAAADPAAPAPAAPAAPDRRPVAFNYADLWRRVPRSVAFLIGAFPISVAAFTVAVTLLSAGTATLITFFIGLILLVGMLYAARGFGTVDRLFVQWAGQRAIPVPDFQDDRARTGFLGWVRAVFGNGHYWLYLLHNLVVDFPLKTFSFAVTVTWVSGIAGGLTFWFWGRFLPSGSGRWHLSEWLAGVFQVNPPADPFLFDVIWYLLWGLVFALTLPLVMRGLVLMHWWVARGMLGGWRSEQLRVEVARLEGSRAAATSAEGQSLRRLERDIHDGPQQRLVRLQMDLAAAERKLDSEPDAARELIAEAMSQSREALDELRALSRGFAPPILLDRGLVAALESAAVRSTVTAQVTDELPAGLELPPEVARNAYFIASEALANAAKHAGANRIDVRVALRREPDGSWLDVSVTDDGRGGALAVPGHGIAGLRDRVQGLQGTLEVDSPAGGPTVVRAALPVASTGPAATAASGQDGDGSP